MTPNEKALVESRFKTKEETIRVLPHAMCLFHRNQDVEDYNNEVFQTLDTVFCVAYFTFSGYKNNDQLVSMTTKLDQMSTMESRGLPYVLKLLLDKPYMITSNVDIDDDLVNGTMGTIKYVVG